MTGTDRPEMPTVRRGSPSHRGQIKTRDRVRELAEVYTHEQEVKAMLDLIPDMFPSAAGGIDIKFLEPACGSGNFLEEVLQRKLLAVRFKSIRSVGGYEHRILRAVASIYGVDISADNVGEAKDRLVSVVRAHYYNDANSIEPTDGFVAALHAILQTNLIQANFLEDASRVEVIDYQPVRGRYFKRAWSMLDDSAVAEFEPNLFHQEPSPKRDARPVHYLDLASMPEPTRSVESASGVDKSA